MSSRQSPASPRLQINLVIYSVVDQNGSIKSDNIKATYDGTKWTTAKTVNYSPSYQYYAYYPYTTSGLSNLGTSSAKGSVMASETSAASGTQAANDARAANATRAVSANTSASDFFASGISAFTPATNQSTAANFNASDLQVGKATINRTTADDISFDLSHAMGLAEITIPTTTKSVPTEIVYNGNDGSVTSQNATAVTISISKSFSGITPYNTGKNNLYAVLVNPSTGTTLATTASGGSLSWSHTFYIASNDLEQYNLSTERVSNRPAYTVIWNYDYLGSVKELTTPTTGTYKLEVWGAEGSYSRGFSHGIVGKGGYAVGNMSMISNQLLYICVGGSPVGHSGYNGGYGQGANYGGGGGCTHIAVSTNRGVLSNYENYKSDVVIVAGGGGGDDVDRNIAGSGGGVKGGDGTSTTTGGTQTSGGSGVVAGSFGKGGIQITSNDAGAGGGAGWYGGGGSFYTGGLGSGGSGYIGYTQLTDKHMAGYNVPTSDAADTKTISVTNHSSTATSDYAKDGDGYARITLVP